MTGELEGKGSGAYKKFGTYKETEAYKEYKTYKKYKTYTTDTVLPARTSKNKNKRSKGIKTHRKTHFSNVTFPGIWNYVNFANFKDSLF